MKKLEEKKDTEFYRAPFPKETLSLFEQTRGRPRFIFHVALAVIKAVARNAGFRNATSWLPRHRRLNMLCTFSLQRVLCARFYSTAL